MSAAKDELERRLRRKLADVGIADAAKAARVVAESFWTVGDEWEKLDVTEFQHDGKAWLYNRYLGARMPVQCMRFDQLADRMVAD